MLKRFSDEEQLSALRSFPFQGSCCHFDQIAWHTVCNTLVDTTREQWTTQELRFVTTALIDDLMDNGLVERDMVNQDDFWYRPTVAGRSFIQTGNSFRA